MDTSCEILLVADRDPQLAIKAVELITAGRHGTISEGPNGKIIPWIITNKYYTAAVYFLVPPPIGQETKDTLPSDSASKLITDAPALIYVFKKGDATARVTFLQSLPAWKAHEAEVNLALAFESAVPVPGTSSTTEPHDDEDAQSDDFFAENGFEYVLARTNAPSPDDQLSVLGIPRVLDALSSIRWPSLVRNDPAKATHIDPKSKSLPSSVEIAETSLANRPTSLNVSTERLTDAAVLSLFASRICGGAIDEKHVEAIEEWLEEAPASDPHSDFGNSPQDLKTPRAFNDDFTGFFTDPTPRGPLKDISPYTTPVLKSSQLFVGAEEPKKGKYSVDNDPSAWYPTKEEIKSATQRIFGGSGHSSSSNLRDINFDGSDDEGKDFDLSRVFSQLQVMKEEVSHIVDPEEKRKAAAKVAEGFIEGLGLGSEPSTDAESDSDLEDVLKIH